MPRLMIFNATPDAAFKALSASAPGSESNEEMFSASVGMFQPDAEFFTVNVADGERLPQGMTIEDFDGVLITGSPLNVYKDVPEVRRQIELAREIFQRGVPSFGCCWGIQLMCAAIGGAVHLNPRGREIGVARAITLSDEGRDHPLYRDKGSGFDALCSHEDEVAALPACGRRLAGNDVSLIQAAELAEGENSFWGVQYHPEMSFNLVAALIEFRAERHLAESLAKDAEEVAEIVADFRAVHRDPTRKDLAWRYGLTANVLDPRKRRIEFRNWLEAKVQPRAAQRG
ncbi:MAG: type 1 glutamine amidotransferase [Elsteraceae bacterium]